MSKGLEQYYLHKARVVADRFDTWLIEDGKEIALQKLEDRLKRERVRVATLAKDIIGKRHLDIEL